MNINEFNKIILSLPKNSIILDAGCGDGRICNLIKKLRKDVNFYGVDIINQKIPKFIKFSKGDITNLKFKNSFFDLIICFHVLEHLNKPKLALNEFYRVLKPRGSLIIEVPHKISKYIPRMIGYNFWQDSTHKHAYDKKELTTLLNNFQIKKIKFDNSIHNYFNKNTILRSLLNLVGLNRTVLWAHLIKPARD